jgi:hypothetical protein
MPLVRIDLIQGQSSDYRKTTGEVVSIVFACNGPLIYRCEANNGEQRETAGR